MTDENKEVNNVDVEKVVVEPAGDDEEAVDDESDSSGSDQGGEADESEADGEGDGAAGEGEDEKKAAQTVIKTTKTTARSSAENTSKKGADGLSDVDGETPRERALRAQLLKATSKLRKEQSDDLLGKGDAPAAAKKPELSEDKKKLLAKYKPQDVQAFKDLLDVVAEDMGYVKKGELQGSTYAEKAQDALDGFLTTHPEYLPENDVDGLLWGEFKQEYGQYKQPANPKEFTKLFEKIHRQVFNIQPGGSQGKIKAAQEKIKVASHAGASNSGSSKRAENRPKAATGLRLDALKGFSDEEIADMQQE